MGEPTNRFKIEPTDKGWSIIVEVFRNSYSDAIKALEESVQSVKQEHQIYKQNKLKEIEK
jgi:molybdopterin synthase catalytic subunit